MMKQVVAVFCLGVMSVGAVEAATTRTLKRCDAVVPQEMSVIVALDNMCQAAEALRDSRSTATGADTDVAAEYDRAKASLAKAMAAYFCKENELDIGKNLVNRVGTLFGQAVASVHDRTSLQSLINRAFYDPEYMRTLPDSVDVGTPGFRDTGAIPVMSPPHGWLFSPQARSGGRGRGRGRQGRRGK